MQTRRPIRWRIAEVLEGRWGSTIVVAIGLVALAVLLLPLLLKPFEGRPAIPAINQTAVRCDGSITEIRRGMDLEAGEDDPRRICVERARARALVAGVGGAFIVLFTVIAALARAGKIQPKDPAR